jgi:hypothetical protein
VATGRQNQLTKQVGEYLVAAELCRRGLIATTFTGNVPDYDILATNEKQKTIPIQVKATQSTSWQFGDVRKYLDISFDGKRQRMDGKARLLNPNVVFVFVRLQRQGQDDFYILKGKDLQQILYDNYNQEIIVKRKGIRKKKPESYHSALTADQLNQFKDNWRLIERLLSERGKARLKTAPK